MDKGKQKAEGWQQKGMEREAPSSIGLTWRIVSGQITEISGSNTVSTCMYYGLLVLCDSLRISGEHEHGLRAGKGAKEGFDEPLSQTKRKEVQSPHAC